MPNPIQNASITSRRLSKKLGGVLVVVTRGGSSFETTATYGFSRFEHTDTSGFVFETRRVDWKIDVDDYDFGEGLTRPQSGDMITATIGGVIINFTATPTEDENVYQFVDRHTRSVYRIHTLET